jgi:hypothetical protein
MDATTAIITKVSTRGTDHWEITTAAGTVSFWKKWNPEAGRYFYYETGATFGYATLNEAARDMVRINQSPQEAHGFKRGDKVMCALREDGVAHRDGNDAVWEILSFQADGDLVTLHLVGADPSRTCGHFTKSLRPAN